jgi:hypothetical protein
MDFYLAVALPAQFGQAVDFMAVVLLERIEEGMSRRPAVAITKMAEELRILLSPALDARQGDFRTGLVPRLIMIRDA